MGSSVSLCMIVKNEAPRIGRQIEGALGVVDEVHVTDTGSTDGTLRLLERLRRRHPHTITVHRFSCGRTFSFARARNHSFSYARCEWILWLDADDRIDWRTLARFKSRVLDDPGVDVWYLRTVLARNPSGRAAYVVDHARLVRRRTRARWSGDVHETLGVEGLRARYSPLVQIDHPYPHYRRSLARNLRILTDEHQRRPNDARVLYYLAATLYEKRDPESIGLLERYVRHPRAIRSHEIAARLRLADLYLSEGRHADVVSMAMAAYLLDPTRTRAEPFYFIGCVDQQQGHFRTAIQWLARCLRLTPRPPQHGPVTYVGSGECHTWKPLRRIAECYAELGDRARALAYARRVMRYVPLDREARAWAARIRATLRSRAAASPGLLAAGRTRDAPT